MDAKELQAMWDEEAAATAKETPEATPAVETPPEPEAVAEEVPAETPAEVPPETPVDPNEELRATVAQLQDRLRKTEGHIGGLTSELKRTKEAMAAGTAAAQSTNGEAPTSTQMQTASKNPAAWDKLKNDFPEWAEGVEAYMATRQAPQGLTPEQVQERLQQQEAALRAEMAAQLNELRVETRHEGWKETVNSAEFFAWAKAQSPDIQALAASDSPSDAIRMLDLYKSAKAKPVADVAQERKSRLTASATPRGDNTTPRKSVDDMTPRELWEFEAKRRAAATT